MLAIDRYYYIDVHIFDSKLVKNIEYSHVVEFLSRKTWKVMEFNCRSWKVMENQSHVR